MTTLTPLELLIMKSLWRRGTARVAEVRDDLHPERMLAYTTVMTVMDRLFKKGIVRRRKVGRAHVYEAAVSEEAARSDALAVLLDGFFGGSRGILRRYLNRSASPEGDEGPDHEASSHAPRPPIEDSLL